MKFVWNAEKKTVEMMLGSGEKRTDTAVKRCTCNGYCIAKGNKQDKMNEKQGKAGKEQALYRKVEEI